ncbi:restriction endonuclease subunit S [Novipirellula sp.]|uniref:restriction endonuclease subunit S n=1 Tax=Novipirellula sp. TaxID=2795430 RepID=UPI0035625967
MSDGNGALPEGWEKSTIGDVAKIVTGKTPSTKKKEYHGGDIPFVKPGDLDREGGLSTSETYVTELGATQAPRLPASTVLVSCIGNLGKVAILERDAICNQQINAILPTDALESRFTFHWAKTIRPWMEENASATTVTILNKGRFEGAPVVIPPLAEQRRIVSKIESLQERSSRARRALSEVGPLLEQFRQSVLRAAFSGRLTADWREAHQDVEPATELLSRIRTQRRHRWEQSELAKYEAKAKQPPKNWQDKYKEPQPLTESDIEELPELPDGWTWTTVAQVLTDSRTGLVRSAKEQSDTTGVPYIRMQHYDLFGRWNVKDLTHVPASPDEVATCELQPGDVLFNTRNSYELVGKVAIWPADRDGFVFNNNLLRMRFVDSVTPAWIAAQMQSPGFQARIEQFKSATTSVCALYTRDLMAQPVAVAPLIEQERVTSLISSSLANVKEIEACESESESALTQLDQSILAKAFRGELVPQDPRDEPASELLARIRANREATESTDKAVKKRKGSNGKRK